MFYRYQKKWFFVQPEIGYAMKGGLAHALIQYTPTQTENTGQDKKRVGYALDYIDVSLAMGAEVKGFNLNVAPVVSVNTIAQLVDGWQRHTAPYGANRIDIGVSVGTGYRLQVHKTNLLFDVRYQNGFIRAFKGFGIAELNKTLLMTVGVGF